ncbi:type II toxin-antitoxin system RelE/ParE family toxin [Pseudomonas aeruginosa]|uniref:type II toxin-antitoxin system RelE/ParE family toxin n=1 Tax=Pseudomonas aeruginosa TaxID=287 RepID=UPI002042C366|nr:type II toxin-antitoxin system RelE/ParE family toxin [Pseudomonas aeruginosa]MCM3889467.1 type II toxin-antitoxin system RelE/ParE family toxin [Pseudomonas aeruginosa]MCM3940204.1 type II toxin-antitoxin system RelE/ParE family toxin [Pseudomonas aeruginosa]MCM3951080.1 type II toxin-antitoxin system RelE/ParE family toxin [Pseudomonas aeruginosa]MCM3958241.1 type II toxin-antitoxin system RelE/ParE family toxin [Pseudomonas aeruginosa]MCM3964359.1 type II toxin-antitoxin system RelE/ParE
MKVIWASAAEQDRADIFDYISQDNPLAAIRMDELFADAAGRLAEHPHLGKSGLISGTRELIPHESYRLVYEVQDNTVWILALVHTARMWPPRQP